MGDGALAGSIGVSGVSLGFQPRADELLAAGKAQETFTRAGTGRAAETAAEPKQGVARVLPSARRPPGGPGRRSFLGGGERGRRAREKEEHWFFPGAAQRRARG